MEEVKSMMKQLMAELREELGESRKEAGRREKVWEAERTQLM